MVIFALLRPETSLDRNLVNLLLPGSDLRVLCDLLSYRGAEVLLAGLLLITFSLEICNIGVNPIEVKVQIVAVEIAVVDHFPLVSSLGLVHDGGLDRVRILDDSIILIGLQVRTVEDVLHGFVLALHVRLADTCITLNIADLVVGIGELAALLPLLLCPLVMQEALQIIL